MQGIYDLVLRLSFTYSLKVIVFVCLFVTCVNLNRNKMSHVIMKSSSSVEVDKGPTNSALRGIGCSLHFHILKHGSPSCKDPPTALLNQAPQRTRDQ